MITKITDSLVGQMISTWRMSEEGLRLGNQILQEKDELGEAIVRAVKCVEDNPSYVSVGYGGLPNCEGQVGTGRCLYGWRYPGDRGSDLCEKSEKSYRSSLSSE